VRNSAEESVETRITDLELSTTPLTNVCCNDDMIQLYWPVPFSVAVSFRPDQRRVFCFTPSFAVFPACCNQLNSNLMNLEATVETR